MLFWCSRKMYSHSVFRVIMVISLRSMTNSVDSSTIFSKSTGGIYKVNGKQLTAVPNGENSVEILDLAYNHIEMLPDFAFQQYKNLRIIDLHENRLKNISPTTFSGLRKLTYVNLSNNNLSNLSTDMFNGNHRMEKLDLTSNRLTLENGVFLSCSSLQTLVLSHNLIEQIHESTFSNLKHLTNLFLDHNENLVKINSKAFSSLSELQFVSLSNTKIVSLTYSMFYSNSFPRVIDLTSTPLAKKFDPELTRIKKDQVSTLLQFEP